MDNKSRFLKIAVRIMILLALLVQWTGTGESHHAQLIRCVLEIADAAMELRVY